MSRPVTVLLLALSLFADVIHSAAAHAQDEPKPAAAAPAPAPAPGTDPFAGTFRVKGTTTDVRSGDARSIAGIIVMREKDGVYSASSDFETKYPAEGGAMDAHVIGTATGKKKDDVLEGQAETQLVMGSVPGVEADFAFAPRIVGPRLQSTWKARMRSDGTLVIEIENRAAPGETYSPTRTTLYGTRIEDSAE